MLLKILISIVFIWLLDKINLNVLVICFLVVLLFILRKFVGLLFCNLIIFMVFIVSFVLFII